MSKFAHLSARALLLILACTGSSMAIAQEASGTAPDEAKIRALEDQEREAVLAGDTAALERLWSEQLTVNNPQSRVSASRQDVFDLVKRGLIKYQSFERRIEAIRQHGDVVIVMGAEEVVPVGDMPRAGQKLQRRFTNIWKKEAGAWKLIARHANLVPAA